MTSEQIQKLNLMVAENGRAMPDGSHEAVSLMHVQMLGEIAYQLAVANEYATAKVERETPPADRCGKCGRPWWSHSPEECKAAR